MNNSSVFGQEVINHSDSHIEYLAIEKDLSIREESLRNFSFEAGNKSHKQQAASFFANYVPLLQSFPIAILRQSPNLRTKHYKQSTYYGEFQNAKKEGLGIMVYRNGKKYQGHWQNDKKSGLGTQLFPNECVYSGNYQLGKPNGEGTYKWPTGQFYKGRWKNGQRHGSGKWLAIDGSSYQGQWRLSKPQGFGVYKSSDGGTYEGQFKDSLKHGEGVQKFANGDMYRGSYVNGKPSGIGAYYWVNGSYFKGSFLNGLRQGKGLWKRGVGNSDKYQGNYKNDRKWGYGEFTWESGNVYKGHYQADSRNGYGQMNWTNGACYKGHWLDGVQHGPGQIHVPGLGYKKGKFDNNVLVQLQQQNLVQNSFREAHKNQRRKKKTTTNSSINENQTVSHNSVRSKKRRNLLNTREDPQKSSFDVNFDEAIYPSRSTKYQQTLIQDGRRTGSLHRYRQKKKTTLPEQNILYSRQVETTRVSNYKELPKPFIRSQKPRKYATLDPKKGKTQHQVSFFKKNNFLTNVKWQSDKDEQIQSQYAQNKPHSKQRLLHSSFYLYKLRQRHIPETTNMSQTKENPNSNPFSS